MFVIYNHIGVLMGFATLPGLVLDSALLAGALLIIVDLLYRLVMRQKAEGYLFALVGPRSGGQFLFVPVWLWGLLLATGLIHKVLGK